MIHFKFNFYGWLLFVVSLLKLVATPFFIGDSRGAIEPLDVFLSLSSVIVVLLALQGVKRKGQRV